MKILIESENDLELVPSDRLTMVQLTDTESKEYLNKFPGV
jgi:hypothetical protein